MPASMTIAATNLTQIAVLAFALGFIATRLRSDLRLPDAIYTLLSVYLLLGIGLKGGVGLRNAHFPSVAGPAAVTIALGVAIPFLAYAALRWLTRLSTADRGAVAAHYGSTSLVTFMAALMLLDMQNISYEAFMPTLLTIMEVPGIIIGIWLATRHRDRVAAPGDGNSWRATLHEVLAGRTVLLLVGGLVIGAVAGEPNYAKVEPFFKGLQPGLLALFLLHLGCIAGQRFSEVRKAGAGMVVFALVFPVFAGALGVLAADAVGLSVGGATVLGVLCASASYIAAPAAVGIAVPQANLALPISASLGVTFPFNLGLGIPLFYELAAALG
ncbi:MAG: hypothetical protein RL745_554 [Actinomycetota bacterium]